MPWYVYPAFFFGGAFLANALPHLLTGIARRPFPSPFASPPFRGLSSPTVNVAWAIVNLGLAYLLIVRAGAIDFRQLSHVGLVMAGFTAMAFLIGRSLKGRRAS
jgi:hypothetical protein